jgi:hypothetical protein
VNILHQGFDGGFYMAGGRNWTPLRWIAVTHVGDLSQDPYQIGSILDVGFLQLTMVI